MKNTLKFALLCGASLSPYTVAQSRPTPLTPDANHVFFDRTNLALFSADFLTRTLDGVSTERFLDAPCKCYVEENVPGIAKSPARMYAYSGGVALALVGASYVAHKTGHHKIERMIPISDIGYDGRLVISNFRLVKK